MEVRNASAQVEHEATTSKISDDQLFYCMQRGLSAEDAVSMIVSGFCKQVFKELPMEFAVEAQKLLGRQPRRQRRLKKIFTTEARRHGDPASRQSPCLRVSVVKKSEHDA